MKDTDEKVNVMTIEAESRLQATKAKYAALLEEGRAELKNLEAFEAYRKHNYELAKAKTYEEMSKRNKNIVMSGEAGEGIL